MKFEIKIIFVLILLLMLSSWSVAQKTELIEQREAGEFSVLVFENSVPMYHTYVIKVLNKEGEQTDKLEFVHIRSEGLSCTEETYGAYNFLSDRRFKVEIKVHDVHCAADPNDPNGVDLSEVLAMIDPYKIIGQEKITLNTVVYSISETGKVLSNSRKNEILKDKISQLEIFDLLPKKNLRILRNCIFAKYGYTFKSADLQKVFSQQEWYKPTSGKVDDKLTDNDKIIIDYILSLEKN